MIWDEDVRVIVMLTAESEGGQVKCHPYWKNNEYGNLSLRLLSEKKASLDVDKYGAAPSVPGPTASAASAASAASETGRRRAQTLINSVEGNNIGHGPGSSGSFFGQAHNSSTSSSEVPFVYIRKFALSHRGQAFSPIREVTQLHYPSWPDFGTPAKPSHLLALVELANAMQRASSPSSSSDLNSPASMTKSPSMPVVHPTSSSSSADVGKLDNLFWPLNEEPESNPTPKPMLVHCSAGCGRTGAFCTVDSVVDMLKRQQQRSVRRAKAATAGPSPRQSEEDVAMTDGGSGSSSGSGSGSGSNSFFSSSANQTQTLDADKGFDAAWLDSDQVDLVAHTVEDFRTQRLSMVQSLRQYVLCYEAIAEWLTKTRERRNGGGIRGLGGRARSESLRMTLG